MITTMQRLILLPALLLAACGTVRTASVDPVPAPATDTAVTEPARGYTHADVEFMQGMIGHHAQALVMTDLLRSRTTSETFHLLAERIDVSQRDEIALMQRWLRARGEAVPAANAHEHAAMGHGELMPGMLAEADLERLRGARGTEFERLFLQSMIRHHEGAIVMVERLLATPGGGREPELFMFASDVNADQAAEIRRMRALLATLPPPAG